MIFNYKKTYRQIALIKANKFHYSTTIDNNVFTFEEYSIKYNNKNLLIFFMLNNNDYLLSKIFVEKYLQSILAFTGINLEHILETIKQNPGDNYSLTFLEFLMMFVAFPMVPNIKNDEKADVLRKIEIHFRKYFFTLTLFMFVSAKFKYAQDWYLKSKHVIENEKKHRLPLNFKDFSSFNTFISWGLKHHNNACFDTLLNLTAFLEKQLNLSYIQKDDNVLFSITDKHLIQTFILPEKNNTYTKTIKLDFRTIYLELSTENSFLYNKVKQEPFFFKQVSKYCCEFSVYLRLIRIANVMNELLGTKSSTTFAEKISQENATLVVTISQSTTTSNKEKSKIIALLNDANRNYMHILNSVLEIIQNFCNN